MGRPARRRPPCRNLQTELARLARYPLIIVDVGLPPPFFTASVRRIAPARVLTFLSFKAMIGACLV